MPVGMREQLAALLVEEQDSALGPQLHIVGTPGQWFVRIAHHITDMWLGSVRRPYQARVFKTLDAAHAAAIDIARLAQPGTDAPFHAVSVVMKGNT